MPAVVKLVKKVSTEWFLHHLEVGLTSYLLFALLCTVSVVKADHVQDGVGKSCIRREIGVSMATSGPFWQINLLSV